MFALRRVACIVDTARTVGGTRSTKRSDVRPSVDLSHRSPLVRSRCGFAAGGWAGRTIVRQWRPPGAAAARRLAADASSVTLSADVGS